MVLCPKCQAELPDNARFCGVCGFKFEAHVTGVTKAPTIEDKDPQKFFSDSTATTDAAKTQMLFRLSQDALAQVAAPKSGPGESGAFAPSTAAPPAAAAARPRSATTQAAASGAEPSGKAKVKAEAKAETSAPAKGEPAAPRPATAKVSAADPAVAEAPGPAAEPSEPQLTASAGPADAAEPSLGAGPAKAFEFHAEDFSQALTLVAAAAGKEAPAPAPTDVDGFYKTGEAAGLERKALESALHDVAAHRVRGPATSMTDEFEPIQPSKAKIIGALVGAVAVLGILIAVLSSGGTPPAAAPGDSSASASGGEKGAEGGKRKAGNLDMGQLSPAIQAVGGKVQPCHDDARKRNATLSGSLTLEVVLEEDGTVSKVDAKEDTLKDAELLTCVKGVVNAHAWPKPKGGYASFAFPVSFQVTQAGGGKAPVKKKK